MTIREEIAVLSTAAVWSWVNIPIGGSVRGPDGGQAIGIVDKVVFSPLTGETTHLRVRCFGKAHHDIMVPLTDVATIHDGVVQLNVPVERLPRATAHAAGTHPAPPDLGAAAHGYEPDQVLFALPELGDPSEDRSDSVILEQVLDALRSYGPTRHLVAATDSVTMTPGSQGPMRVAVRNGVVILAGNVELRTYAGMAERRARWIPGVGEVLNLLIADNELQTSVKAALHYDPRIRHLQPRVWVADGQVTLSGKVADAAGRDAVGAVAGAVPGVRGVVNRLCVEL